MTRSSKVFQLATLLFACCETWALPNSVNFPRTPKHKFLPTTKFKCRSADYSGRCIEKFRGGASYESEEVIVPHRKILKFNQLGAAGIGEYFGSLVYDEIGALLPVCLILIVFQTIVLGLVIQGADKIVFGLGLVIVGLALFKFGFLYGLMPTGLELGLKLPELLSLNCLLGISSVLGIAAALAEPALGIVKTAGAQVKESRAPYVFALLHRRQGSLVLAIVSGVGLAAALGILRIRRAWSQKTLSLLSTAFTLILSSYVHFFSGRREILGLAWDLGAVTTGPVTVPLVIALGVGVASVSGEIPSPLTGFGVVTLASLIPVNTMLLLGLLLPSDIARPLKPMPTSPVSATVKSSYHVNILFQHALTIAEFFVPSLGGAVSDAQAQGPPPAPRPPPPWHMRTPAVEVVAGLQAMAPLVLLMLSLRFLFLGDWGLSATSPATILDRPVRVPVALALMSAQIGVFLFKIGLSFGLAPLGATVGGALPAAFRAISGVSRSPLFSRKKGRILAVGMAALLGIGATLAEPALGGLASAVEELTQGQLGRTGMVWSVAVGVGAGVAIGVARMMAGWPLFPLLLGGYLLAGLLTLFGDEMLVSVAWDSAGVTTGPITSPLVISLGLGLSREVDLSDGFGILSLATVCPIISVLAAALFLPPSRKRRGSALPSAGPFWPAQALDASDLTWKAPRPRGRSWREDSGSATEVRVSRRPARRSSGEESGGDGGAAVEPRPSARRRSRVRESASERGLRDARVQTPRKAGTRSWKEDSAASERTFYDSRPLL